MSKEKIYNTAQQLMAGRLGYKHSEAEAPEIPSYGLQGLDALAKQLKFQGGYSQQSRMIQDKRMSLNRSLLYSYQAAFVKKVLSEGYKPTEEEKMMARALINPNKLKMDYDDKIISIGFEHNYHSGDVFEWVNTGSYWLIKLQDLDELAYFRGEIRRCDYTIKWEDEEGKIHSTYAAVRGPVETKINFIQKHQISVDNPNYSLLIYMPRTPEATKYFTRYSKFYLQDDDKVNSSICWRVTATDSISTPGILELTAVEYYANESEDDIDEGLVGSLVVKHIEPSEEGEIKGLTFIKPKTDFSYSYEGEEEAEWIYDKKLPIKATIDGKNIIIRWDSPYSDEFVLHYGDSEKTIVVESLF